ncbi:hypothetical protein MRX96_042046 [Rhipicephalus microplus]
MVKGWLKREEAAKEKKRKSVFLRHEAPAQHSWCSGVVPTRAPAGLNPLSPSRNRGQREPLLDSGLCAPLVSARVSPPCPPLPSVLLFFAVHPGSHPVRLVYPLRQQHRFAACLRKFTGTPFKRRACLPIYLGRRVWKGWCEEAQRLRVSGPSGCDGALTRANSLGTAKEAGLGSWMDGRCVCTSGGLCVHRRMQ